MKNKLIIIVLIIIIGVSIYSINNYNKTSSTKSSTENSANDTTKSADNEISNSTSTNGSLNKVAADFTLKDLKGNTITLSSLKGKNVLLNFWATWCPPCRGEMPDIQKLYSQTKDSDLVILAVDIGEDTKTVQDFITKNNYEFNILLDSDKAVATNYNISSIPTSFFINKEGKIINKHIGAMSLEDMRSNVAKLTKK